MNAIIYCIPIAALISNAQAATILYNLRDTGAASSIQSGSYSVDGVQMSLSSSQGDLNQTSSGFGVNIKNDGGDISHLIDGGVLSEAILFSFDSAGTSMELKFGSFTAGDSLSIHKNGSVIGHITTNSFVVATAFNAGDEFTIQHSTGNGLSWNSVEITAVPEPTSSLFLGFGGLALLVQRKRSACRKE